jgi:amino acid adenylation domain-containing protein
MNYLLQHFITDNAAKYPHRAAVIYKNSTITYADLEKQSNQLAQGLIKMGVAHEDRVGIYMNRGIDAIVSIFGVLKAGATYVPIDPLCPPERLNYIITKCAMHFVLTIATKVKAIARAFPQACPLDTILVMNGKENQNGSFRATKQIAWQAVKEAYATQSPDVPAIDTDLAYILFTSGSTGTPKGVMLSHLNALTFVNAARKVFEITPADRMSNVCPLYFDMSVFDLHVAFKAGATVVILPETDALFPVNIADYIQTAKITVWNSVPSALCLLAALKDLDQYDLSSLRLVLFAGELFPVKYLRRLKELMPGARFCNMYGQTEANSSLYYWVDRAPADAAASLPIGKVLPNFEAFALDSDGKMVCTPGKTGELYIRSSTIAQGYWGEPEKTRQAFVMHPLRPDQQQRVYKTGDLVQRDGEGNFLFLGRKDHMIKSRGYRIEIGEIEAVLRSHPEIRNAVVIPVPDDLIGNRLSAYIVEEPDSAVTKQDLVVYCSRQLPKYMIPETFLFRTFLPKTASGKIDRKQLSCEFN